MLEKPNHSHQLVHDLNFDPFASEQYWQQELGASSQPLTTAATPRFEKSNAFQQRPPLRFVVQQFRD